MKTIVCLLVVGLVGVGAAGADQGRGRGEGRGEARGADAGRDGDKNAAKSAAKGADKGNAKGTAKGNVVFATRDVTAVRSHYGGRYKNLPPGLQKKLARGDSLPPGWEKKMEPFPAALDRNLVVLPAGYQRGVMDGQAVIYNPITRVIMDIVALF